MPNLASILFATGPQASAVSIPTWLDAATVIIGSLAGALAARDRKLDLVGYVGLAIVCGLGGGLIRDVAMQKGGVYMLQSRYAIGLAVMCGVAGLLFPRAIDAHPHLLEWLDIISVGLFAATGADKALAVGGYGSRPLVVILLGTLTGVGGGMLRDVFLGEVPRIFQRSNLYATCAILGATTYYLLVWLVHLRKHWAVLACVAVTAALRRWSLRYDVRSPTEVDLAAHARRAVERARDRREERDGETPSVAPGPAAPVAPSPAAPVAPGPAAPVAPGPAAPGPAPSVAPSPGNAGESTTLGTRATENDGDLTT